MKKSLKLLATTIAGVALSAASFATLNNESTNSKMADLAVPMLNSIPLTVKVINNTGNVVEIQTAQSPGLGSIIQINGRSLYDPTKKIAAHGTAVFTITAEGYSGFTKGKLYVSIGFPPSAKAYGVFGLQVLGNSKFYSVSTPWLDRVYAYSSMTDACSAIILKTAQNLNKDVLIINPVTSL